MDNNDQWRFEQFDILLKNFMTWHKRTIDYTNIDFDCFATGVQRLFLIETP